MLSRRATVPHPASEVINNASAAVGPPRAGRRSHLWAAGGSAHRSCNSGQRASCVATGVATPSALPETSVDGGRERAQLRMT